VQQEQNIQPGDGPSALAGAAAEPVQVTNRESLCLVWRRSPAVVSNEPERDEETFEARPSASWQGTATMPVLLSPGR